MEADLKDFRIDGLLLFVEKPDHLNSQIAGQAAEFGLEGFRGEMHFKLKVSHIAVKVSDGEGDLQILYKGHFFPRLETS